MIYIWNLLNISGKSTLFDSSKANNEGKTNTPGKRKPTGGARSCKQLKQAYSAASCTSSADTAAASSASSASAMARRSASSIWSLALRAWW